MNRTTYWSSVQKVLKRRLGMPNKMFHLTVERGFFSAGGEIKFSPAKEKNYLPMSGAERQNLRREESVAQKGIRQRLIAIEERMNSSNGFWLNFRKIDVGDRVLLQILIDGKDALLTEELDSFLKNAAMLNTYPDMDPGAIMKFMGRNPAVFRRSSSVAGILQMT